MGHHHVTQIWLASRPGTPLLTGNQLEIRKSKTIHSPWKIIAYSIFIQPVVNTCDTMDGKPVHIHRHEKLAHGILEQQVDGDQDGRSSWRNSARTIQQWEDNVAVKGEVNPHSVFWGYPRILAPTAMEDLRTLLKESPTLYLDEIVDYLTVIHRIVSQQLHFMTTSKPSPYFIALHTSQKLQVSELCWDDNVMWCSTCSSELTLSYPGHYGFSISTSTLSHQNRYFKLAM